MAAPVGALAIPGRCRSDFTRPQALRGRLQDLDTDSGYALIVVMMATTLLLISLTAALPNLYTAGQREREAELIFRGNEYARAILLFRRQFRRYPTSVKELLETNGIHFLRREYKDPISRSGKWRFVHADASGTPIDSRTFAQPLAGGLGKPNRTTTEGKKGEGEEGTPGVEEGEQSSSKSAFFGEGKEIRGAFIIGVASTSRKESIRVWNGKTRYQDWEFLGIETAGAGGATPNLPPAPQGQPGAQQGRRGGFPEFPQMPPLSGPMGSEP
jgi:type II secretory pathway pseudopilin PulG